MEFSAFLVFAVWTSSLTYFTFGKERERAMVFPDYYFFAERRLVNHTIDEKCVKNLDDCELFCYLNDDCVSLNYKKDPENDETGYNCQLNNATHLKYDSDLTTDAKFYYRGSKNACDKSPQCQNNATCQSGFTFKEYRCLCPSGYKGEHCEKDVDECKVNHSCHENANCTNTFGSHVCYCQPGYTGNGHNCTDIDECGVSPGKCPKKAACNNTHGSYVCTCEHGFIGDGQNCTDVDECKGNHSCHENANCTNTIGSHKCYCKPGYTGNGQNCTDIDECSQAHPLKMNECHPNASCINTQGSYNCSCNLTFIGNGFECKADPCHHYSNLSEANRNREHKTEENGPVLCDRELAEGWYRFEGRAGTKMPTSRVPAYRCGTDWSGWLDGIHPTVEDCNVNRKVCFSDRSTGCKYSKTIVVKNCGSYFIYKLQKPPCDSRYCGAD